MKQVFGQLSLFDSHIDSIRDDIVFFDSHFYVGYHFLFGVSREPCTVLSMDYGSMFFKLYFDNLGFWHHVYKKSYNKVFFEVNL